MYLRVCLCEAGGAGRVACMLMPQIVVRCRSPSAMRFGQEGNVIGFVQSSWQPTPADICSLLTTQTYLHQGTHTHTHTRHTEQAHRFTVIHVLSGEKVPTCVLQTHTTTFTFPHMGQFSDKGGFSGLVVFGQRISAFTCQMVQNN